MGSRLEKNSANVRKRIENHTFNDEDGEEYGASTFGGFTDYMRRKKVKLQNLDAELRSQSTDKPQIFRGIVAQVNGYTQPSLSDLHKLIVTHGGGFLQYLDGKTAVTHIIASQLTLKKKAEFARYRIVRPAWVVDSVAAGRVLPWENYRVVDAGVTQKVLGFDNGQMVSQVNNQHQSYRGQSESSWYTSQVKQVVQELGGGDDADGGAPLTDNLLGEGSASSGKRKLDLEDDPHDRRMSRDSPLNAQNAPDAKSTATAEDSRDSASADPGGSNHLLFAEAGTEDTPKRQLTAEEHNAILLQNPHMAKSSTANPDFLNQYYRESRLHHLSSWKAELKAQLQARAAEKSSSQKSRHKRGPNSRCYIMHVDFDSFFVAVSLRKNPHLVDQAVVVAHGSGPGSEIASCNYPARKFGVKNGMWMKTALTLCSNLKVLPYDFKAYEEASKHFYDTILDIDGVVQSISIDEALVDVSLLCGGAGATGGDTTTELVVNREQAKVNELGNALRAAVRQKTGCEVSVGIGSNILQAKVALRKAKPAGQYLMKPEDACNVIGDLKVGDLPGVAHSLSSKLEEIGVKLVKDIRNLNKERLMTHLGPKTGEKLWDYSRGIDKTEVGVQVIRKSVSAEVNWGIRFVTQQQAEEFVQCLCDELHKRLLENVVKGRQLTMKIMLKAADAGMDPPKNLGHGKCDTFNKSVILGVATNDKTVLGKEAISILRAHGFSPGELRGLGVQMQKLEPIKPADPAGAALVEGSQRRLQFKKPDTPSTKQAFTPRKTASSPSPVSPVNAGVPETIEDVPTPEKARPKPFIVGAIGQHDTYADEKPLNIIGTQFIMSSQVDPTVLAELPSDIRSKFAPQPKLPKTVFVRSESPITEVQSRPASLYPADFDLPNQSQLDLEALAALPEDMKEELLMHYQGAKRQAALSGAQTLLPQSPRKSKLLQPSKKIKTTPTKPHKISGLLAKGRSKSKASSSTLTQSNFVSLQPQMKNGFSKTEPAAEAEISQSFLAELPEDIRHEVLAEQKRYRMKTKSGLDVDVSRKRSKLESSKDDLPRGQQRLYLPPQSDKPAFTSRKLRSLPELREAMSAWVQQFSSDGEEGPFKEDTSVLGQYLARVVLEEEDMAKAISVVDWLTYLVDDWPFDYEEIRIAWLTTVKSLQSAVQDAVLLRGLPPVEFGTI